MKLVGYSVQSCRFPGGPDGHRLQDTLQIACPAPKRTRATFHTGGAEGCTDYKKFDQMT